MLNRPMFWAGGSGGDQLPSVYTMGPAPDPQDGGVVLSNGGTLISLIVSRLVGFWPPGAALPFDVFDSVDAAGCARDARIVTGSCSSENWAGIGLMITVQRGIYIRRLSAGGQAQLRVVCLYR